MRTFSVIILSLTVAACGAAAATPQPASTPAAATPAAATPAAATPAPSVAATPAATTAPTVAAAGGLPDCSGGQIGRKAFTMAGFQAQHYCGPATATVTAAGLTATITSGWCETNAAGFSVSIGTQLFGSPDVSQEPDLLIILVQPTTGDGPVSGTISHHHYLLTGSPVH
ncbi:MAG: hypothetical protein ACXWN4_05890, partial [Candidatus Limnocylindrales bacterium]